MHQRDGKTSSLTDVDAGIVVMACECGQADCREHVFIPFAGHRAIRDQGGAVLAPGHHLSRAQLPGGRGRRLYDDAAA